MQCDYIDKDVRAAGRSGVDRTSKNCFCHLPPRTFDPDRERRSIPKTNKTACYFSRVACKSPSVPRDDRTRHDWRIAGEIAIMARVQSEFYWSSLLWRPAAGSGPASTILLTT